MDEMKRDENLKLLISLKQQKKDGTLDSEECLQNQEYKWRNKLDYMTLEYWLKCNSEELRLNTLQLLTISKKTTLCFSKKELDLILMFLRCNIREKIDYVPLIKKVLQRLNDSYAVLKRQLEKEHKFKKLQQSHQETPVVTKNLANIQGEVQFYKKFVNTLHEICLKNLYQGAVNIRKKSSLQILCLMDEFLDEDLKGSLWNLEKYKKLFDCLLLDTYESNKDMAFHLLKSCKLTKFFFDSKEKVLELIDVAVQLGNSIRPLDSITAAYMLKISMLIPNIQEILLELIEFEKQDSLVEKTTFYMIMLLKIYLKEPVKLAVKNIVIAASKHSLYGYVFCIRSILSTINLSVITNDECWKKLISDLINMCFSLNVAVSQIVNSSSPEGHLPMDLNPQHLDGMLQSTEDVIITPQMVLLCSWRTVKEISLFFGYVTSNVTIYNEKTKTGLLAENQIKEIGNQLVTLLCETKHRGAFEQAHVGFSQLCGRLWHLEKEQIVLKQLPKVWLQQLLLAVIGLTPENSKLCATRRSAGVPFMVQALVTSEIKRRCDQKALTFHLVMKILLKLTNINDDFNLNDAKNLLISETLFKNYDMNKVEEECCKLNEITEIKTHSLNILKALYRHCLLGDLVKDYIAEGFIAAFRSYDGKSWAERNAATLLFSSLVVRVFGVQRTKDHVNLTVHNRMTGKTFFDKFPSLLPFLLNELTIFVNEPENQIKPKIQSILLILSRLYSNVTSETTDEDWKIDQFIDLVSKCGKSRVYKTRELAARALVPLLTEKNILIILNNLLNLMTGSELPLNLLHGYTLQLLELVRSSQFTKVELPNEQLQKFDFLISNILCNLEASNNGPACFPVCTSVLEIFIELSKMNSYSWIYTDSTFLCLLEKIQPHLTNSQLLKKRPAIELYEVTVLNLFITALDNVSYNGFLINNEYLATQFWENILKQKNPVVLKVAWSKLIYIIQKTKSPMLYDLGIMSAIKYLDEPVEDPDLQDAILDFIYNAIIEMEKNAEYVQYTFSKEEEKCYMCMHIFNKLNQQLKKERFCHRGEFFKLHGKVFGFLLKNNKDSDLSRNSKKLIFDTFVNQSNMESNLDCRIGISEVLFDLYIELSKKSDIYLILDWWTILLQLLYDDNFQIRSNAAQIICKLLPETILECETIITDTFFLKFVATVGQNIAAVIAAFFCWSMKSAAIVLEEMDETDVFNKSCNYECFEPLQITNHCLLHLKNIMFKHNISSIILSKSIKEWLQKHLNIEDIFDFETLNELIFNYKEMIADTEKPLKKLLDPTYPAKFIKEIAYHKIKNIIINGNDVDISVN